MEHVKTRKTITLAAADMIAHAAELEAINRGARVVIAIVDDHGKLILLRRLDQTQVASVDVAIDKARTAAIFRRPSKDFEDQTRHGRVAALALHGAVALQGGMPIVYDGEVIGAIGVSGASSADEDQELATIGASAAGSFSRDSGDGTARVFHASADAVSTKFLTGGLLLDDELYKVDAGRRDRPGEVELHTFVTDVMYVLEGEATVITGGEVVELRQVGPDEYRGSALSGGATQDLAKGDVMVIPQGVPHWFKTVSGPLLYYVVKIVQAH